jgi:hypothetical protein
MSQGFGVDIYGLATYGYSQPADYSVAPFVATQTDYGDITLSWASPNTTSWKVMELVRSTYGYPSRPEDGVVLTTIYPGTIVRTYDDPGLDSGVIYYYSMFISVEAPTWNSGSTYILNQQVLYNGLYWTSTQNSNTNHIPAAGSSFWSPTNYIPTWYPAGFTATLSIGNQGYTTRLYDRTPQPYKISTSDTFSNTAVDNQALFNYESIFGFGLDMLKAEYDSYLELGNADTVSATYLDMLGQQLGIQSDYLSTPQQRRQRVKNAAVNYRMKGQTQSIHNLIAELAGWDSEITYGPNMYNDADQTAFVHPTYDLWSANTTYFVNQIIQYNGYNYKNLVQSKGQAQAPTGTTSANTWWTVQQYISDTTTNKNPQTNQQSTWGYTGAGGATGSIVGVRTGLPHPTDTAINNWNALSIVQTNVGGTDLLDSTTALYTPNYSSGTNYVIDNNVLYTDGYYYKALKPSGPGTAYGAKTPGTDQSFWQPFYFTTADRPNIIRDGIPVAQLPQWNSTTKYAEGTQVEYLGIVYQAGFDNINSQPSGYYYSNADWVFISPSQKTLVSSGAWGRNVADAGINEVFTTLWFYDKNGNLINNTSSFYSGYNVNAEGVVARYVADYADLAGTTEPSLANAATDGTIGNAFWLPSIEEEGADSLWRSSYGMAWVDQVAAGTTAYLYLTLDVGNTRGRLGVTFATDYTDTGHKTHGVIFDWQDSLNFYYVTRTSLRRVNGGVDTSLASWTRLEDEDRILVDVNANIDVYKYTRNGDGSLTRICHSVATGPSAGSVGRVGIIQKYSATGAL